MMHAILLVAIVEPPQSPTAEQVLNAQLDKIISTSLSHGCDPELFFGSSQRRFEELDGIALVLREGSGCVLSASSRGTLEFRFSSHYPNRAELNETEQGQLWSEESCLDLAVDLLQSLRPGIIWDLFRTDYSKPRGTAKFTFLPKASSFPYRETIFDRPTTIEIDAARGIMYHLYLEATPTTRPENLEQIASNTVLHRVAVDAYASFLPYAQARIWLSEASVMSARPFLSGNGVITDRHRQIAQADEGMLVYRIIVQRLSSGRPTLDYRYVIVDALTGIPMITWELPFEALMGRGTNAGGESNTLSTSGLLKAAGTNGGFQEAKKSTASSTFEGTSVLVEYESGAIVTAEFDSAQSLLRVGNPDPSYYQVDPELKASLDAAIERQKKLPPWKKPGAPQGGD